MVARQVLKDNNIASGSLYHWNLLDDKEMLRTQPEKKFGQISSSREFQNDQQLTALAKRAQIANYVGMFQLLQRHTCYASILTDGFTKVVKYETILEKK